MLETARNTRTDGCRDLVTELLGLWLVLAVFLDGWAHLNLPSLETFFTPWHAALYSGMLATAAWTAVVIWRTPLESGATTQHPISAKRPQADVNSPPKRVPPSYWMMAALLDRLGYVEVFTYDYRWRHRQTPCLH